MWFCPSSLTSHVSTVTVKMECDREDCAFMFVLPTCRRRLPASFKAKISATLLITLDSRPCQHAADTKMYTEQWNPQYGYNPYPLHGLARLVDSDRYSPHLPSTSTRCRCVQAQGKHGLYLERGHAKARARASRW